MFDAMAVRRDDALPFRSFTNPLPCVPLRKIIAMASFRSIEFSCNIPDVTITSSVKSKVVISIDGETIYDEWLYPVEGIITLEDLSSMVTPYARQRQTVELKILATSEAEVSLLSESCDVVYCQADLGDVVPEDFLQTHFLSILMGTKQTAMGRLELLSMTGNNAVSCIAQYSDGTSRTFDNVPVEQNGAHYKTLNVSPENFGWVNKTLISYTVRAGLRIQNYELDLSAPDCAPILVFVNSFGMDEMAYCTGIHKVDPSYKRSMAYVGRKQRNYRIDETRSFKANTGPLTDAMSNWWDDVFRSDSVRIVNIYDGNPNVGKDLIITESKSEKSNDDAEITRFTFTYQYAQRNHNVLQLLRAGRIFDNTFDNTFN